MVQRRTAHLPSALTLTLTSMAVSGSFFGIFGVVLATPLAAAALVAVREGYVVSILHDELA